MLILTYILIFSFFLFFFFQAEDGIRDIGVTGVQTCALPISEPQRPGVDVGVLPAQQVEGADAEHEEGGDDPGAALHVREVEPGLVVEDRSEERRVGKECRSRWSPYH